MATTSKLIDYDSKGNALVHHYDDETNVGTFEVKEDAAPILDLNQKKQNSESGNWKGDMHHVASIPPTIWAEWTKEFGGSPMLPENQPRLMKKLNDRDWLKLRTKTGRV